MLQALLILCSATSCGKCAKSNAFLLVLWFKPLKPDETHYNKRENDSTAHSRGKAREQVKRTRISDFCRCCCCQHLDSSDYTCQSSCADVQSLYVVVSYLNRRLYWSCMFWGIVVYVVVTGYQELCCSLQGRWDSATDSRTWSLAHSCFTLSAVQFSLSHCRCETGQCVPLTNEQCIATEHGFERPLHVQFWLSHSVRLTSVYYQEWTVYSHWVWIWTAARAVFTKPLCETSVYYWGMNSLYIATEHGFERTAARAFWLSHSVRQVYATEEWTVHSQCACRDLNGCTRAVLTEL